MSDAPTAWDQAKMKAFGRKILSDVSMMMLGHLAYIGDRLGLFKILAQRGPLTCEKLAEASSCHPRYLREWLSAMAAAGWIEYRAETEEFVLPPEHAPFLAQEDHPVFIGGLLQAVVPYAEVTPKILECFRRGGGVPFADYPPDIPQIIDRLSAPLFRNFLTRVWIPELLPRVHQKLQAGGKVADVGCGSGRALVEMARAYPQSRFSGYETQLPSVERARALVRQEGLEGRVQIFSAPSSALPSAHYDFITTFDVVHDLVDPQGVLQDIRRALRPDGTYLMMELRASSRLEEMLHPKGTLLYSLSTLYCMTVSLASGGAGIGTCMGEEIPREMCARAGFSHFRRLGFEHPMYVLYEVCI